MKVRLMERMMESLKTSKNQEDVFHTPTPSAGLRLTREGRKTWFIYYRSPVLVDGKRQPKLRRLYLGEHRGATTKTRRRRGRLRQRTGGMLPSYRTVKLARVGGRVAVPRKVGARADGR